VVCAVYHNSILLYKDTGNGVGDQQYGGDQPVWSRRAETTDRYKAWIRSGLHHYSLVHIVDTVRRSDLAGRFRLEGVHHATGLDVASALLQGSQLDKPMDLYHYAPPLQGGTIHIVVDKKKQEATVGM